jgi:uncharacterized protein (TIGR00369 family)
MSDTTSFSPPEGFHEHVSPSNFVLALGPMYKREQPDGTAIIALRVLESHLNLHGIAHGGLVATLIDNAFGYNVAKSLNGAVTTAHLAIDYLSPARLGDWVEAEVRINRKGRRMCFAECTLKNGEVLMARASCILAPVA